MRKLTTLIAPAFAALLLAIACGGDGSSPTPSPARSPSVVLPSPTPEPTPEPTPSNAGTLTTGAIVFSSDREPRGLYLMDADGTNVERIGDGLPSGGLGLDLRALRVLPGGKWSPDGTKVVFDACHGEELHPPLGLYVMNSDGSGLTNVTDAGLLCNGHRPPPGPDWSPDSSRLVFPSGRDPAGLYVANADGSGLRFLTEGFLPDWSPTAESILFVEQFFVCDVSGWETPISLMDADGGNKRLLATVPCGYNNFDGARAPQLRWSPDGTLFAFTAAPEPPDFSQLEAGEEPNHEVFVMKADGSGLTNITNHPGQDSFANWVNCQLPLPTAGCEVTVTNVQPQRLNLREDPGTDQEVTGKLSEGETVCLLGSPGLADGFQWWPLRTADGQEGWAAAFDPGEVNKPWLTATGRTCQGEQIE